MDDISVPIPHFGCVLDWNSFNDLADKLQSAGIEFIVEPNVRFKDYQENRRPCFLRTILAMRLNLKLIETHLKFLVNS